MKWLLVLGCRGSHTKSQILTLAHLHQPRMHHLCQEINLSTSMLASHCTSSQRLMMHTWAKTTAVINHWTLLRSLHPFRKITQHVFKHLNVPSIMQSLKIHHYLLDDILSARHFNSEKIYVVPQQTALWFRIPSCPNSLWMMTCSNLDAYNNAILLWDTIKCPRV